jgi:hypothetical protein
LLLLVTRHVYCCKVHPHIRPHIVLRHVQSRVIQFREVVSAEARDPAQRLFRTTATWESLHLRGNGVKSCAHSQPFLQGGKVFHGLHHEGVIRSANGYMLRLGRHGTCVQTRTPWADVFNSLGN